jgi:hypothetical protein
MACDKIHPLPRVRRGISSEPTLPREAPTRDSSVTFNHKCWCANLVPVTGEQTPPINKHLRTLHSIPQKEITLPRSSSLNMLFDCVNSCFLTPLFLAMAPLHLQKEPPCWRIKLSFWGCRNNSNCWLILYRTRPTQEAQGLPATRMEMFTGESRDLFVLMRGRGNVTAELLVLSCRGRGVS